MADYSSRRTTIIRVALFALLGIVLLGYALLSLEGKEQMVFVGIGLFDLLYAALISMPLWRKKH
jgi:hypothetical protein